MNQEIKTIIKKTAKIGAAVCVASGAVALMTSGAALKALTEGAKYLKDTVKKIVNDEPKAETVDAETVVEEVVAEESTSAQAVIAE